MKKLFVLTLALFTLLTLGAFAQDQTSGTSKKSKKSSTTATEGSTSTMKAKTSKLTGTIGQDGKTFTNDADQSSWTISNPDKVKGHEGHHVTLRGKTDEAAKSIDVTSVTMVAEKGSKSKSKKSSSPTGK
jgi:hypothetical protein